VPTDVTLFFDPQCPWAWMTSRWLYEAAELRDFEPTFEVMSLSVLNERRDLDSGYRDMMDESWGAARVATAVMVEHPEQVADFYTAFGERFHVAGNKDRRAVAAEALDAAGLPETLLAAFDSTTYDPQMRESTAKALAKVGQDVGTPVVDVDGVAFFGPVITPAPKGEEAARLFDGVVAVANTPGFYELKRTRTAGPDFT
jgi:predicted DsbA family dithiol-disulfide isomerase